MMKKYGVLAVVVLLLTLVVPTSADGPFRYTESVHDIVEIDCGQYGFDYILRGEIEGTIAYTLFFDAEGNVNNVQIHWNLHETWTNSVTGKTAFQIVVGPSFVDLETGRRIEAGILHSAHMLGEGQVGFEVGRWVFDGDGKLVFEAGLRRFTTPPDMGPLVCERWNGY